MKNKEIKITVSQVKESKENRDRFIEENSDLVGFVIKSYFGYAYKNDMVEDYFQTGMMGLIKAIDNFDIESDLKFSTYAIPCILGTIKTHKRDGLLEGRDVYTPRRITVALNKYRAIKEKDYSDAELVKLLEVSNKELEDLKNLSRNTLSFDTTNNQDDGNSLTLQDKLKSDYCLEDEAIENMELKDRLNLIAELVPSKTYILFESYLKGNTQPEISKIYGVNQVAVSRAVNKIIKIVCPSINDFYNGNITKNQLYRKFKIA